MAHGATDIALSPSSAPFVFSHHVVRRLRNKHILMPAPYRSLREKQCWQECWQAPPLAGNSPGEGHGKLGCLLVVGFSPLEARRTGIIGLALTPANVMLCRFNQVLTLFHHARPVCRNNCASVCGMGDDVALSEDLRPHFGVIIMCRIPTARMITF